MEDNVAIVAIHSWELACVYFNEIQAKGPVPILFAEDTQAAVEALEEADLTATMLDHMKLMRR